MLGMGLLQVIFPCTLLGTGDPWTLMKTISVTEYLNYEAGLFSPGHSLLSIRLYV
jgi:methionyl-tRNA synthetase